MDAVFHRLLRKKAAALYRSESRRATALQYRFAGKRALEIAPNTFGDSISARFESKNSCVTPVLAQFHSTFGCDLH
jgi:hypothetical protein